MFLGNYKTELFISTLKNQFIFWPPIYTKKQMISQIVEVFLLSHFTKLIWLENIESQPVA